MQQQQQPHGVPGQLNIYVLDKDSEHTSFGKHNRLIVFLGEQAPRISIREDHRGLPESTEADRMRVACKSFQRMHPKGTSLKPAGSEKHHDGTSTWFYYDITAKGAKQ